MTVKRQHEPHQIIGDLLTAEISESEPLSAIGSRTMASARSIKYQMTIAKLPLAKEIDEFDFETAEVNETLIRDLAAGDFLDHQRNLVLIGGTGTGKTHLAVGIARACIRRGRRGRFFNVVDLVNKLDAEARAERQGRTADLISRLDLFAIGLERMATRWLTPGRTRLSPLRPDRRPAPVPPDQQALRADLDHRDNQPRVRRMAHRLRRREDDHRSARPPDPPLRDRRDRKRKLALQEPSIAKWPTTLARRRCVTWGLRSAGPAQLQGGQFSAPIGGHDPMPIDKLGAVGRALVLLCSHGVNPVGSHKPANPALADGQPQLLQLGRHARATIAAQAQPPLLANMGEKHHVLALPPAGRAPPPGAQAAIGNIEQGAQARPGQRAAIGIDECEPHRFWPAKKALAIVLVPMAHKARPFLTFPSPPSRDAARGVGVRSPSPVPLPSAAPCPRPHGP
ncbi:Mobile element protein [Rhodovulum sp. P5]|nr:Mobile element protein [Rhodovulum sp. P5]